MRDDQAQPGTAANPLRAQGTISEIAQRVLEGRWTTLELNALADFALATIKDYQELCAAMYQFAGANSAPQAWLDVLAAAAAGEPFTTDGLLPYAPKAEVEETCWSCKEPIGGCGISGWLHKWAPEDDYDHEAHPVGKKSNDLNTPKVKDEVDSFTLKGEVHALPMQNQIDAMIDEVAPHWNVSVVARRQLEPLLRELVERRRG